MNKLPLPPKRFEPMDDPKWDPLRHHWWWPKLAKRKWQLGALKQASEWLKAYPGSTRKDASTQFGVDERELRDYLKFINPVQNAQKPAFLEILGDSWVKYSQDQGASHISLYIGKEAPFWGVNPRHVVEAWETDPLFYPEDYPANWRTKV